MLGLGIGATTAIFSVVNAVLVRPLPYPDSDALVRIVHVIGGIEQPYFSDAIYLDLCRQHAGVPGPGRLESRRRRRRSPARAIPKKCRALTASRGVLTTLGVQPEIGRWFSAARMRPARRDTVMLTGGYWQRRFGGDPGVLDADAHRQRPPPPDRRRDAGGLPLRRRVRHHPAAADRTAARRSSVFRLTGVARLKPGVTLAQANADAAPHPRDLVRELRRNPAVRARWAPALRPLKQDVVGDVGRTLWVLMGAIGDRPAHGVRQRREPAAGAGGSARRQEFAIRAALGASWTRIARQLLVESLTLALAGGALGVAWPTAACACWSRSGPANLPRLAEISIDPVVLGFALAISLSSGLLFGLIPILKQARPRAGATRSAAAAAPA